MAWRVSVAVEKMVPEGLAEVVGSPGVALLKRVVQAVADADALLMQDDRILASTLIFALSGVAVTVVPA